MDKERGDKSRIDTAVEPAQGFFDLGMHHEAWASLDELSPKDKGHPLTMALRLDILLALHRYQDAVALGTGACRQWPQKDCFFLGTAFALMTLDDHEKAKALLLAAPCSLHSDAKYWFSLARCQGRTGDTDGARKSVWECINRDRGLRELALDDPDLQAVWKSL
jgi:predicted Zn-dependent protease